MSYLLQIDDVDVEKCRQGRLEYLGLMSFLIIAVPTTLILLNDTVGDALIDSALPSIFTGFFFAGTALLSQSLSTLLIPMGILLAMLLYYICVYRPARAAYSQREENMKILSGRGAAHTGSHLTISRERKTKNNCSRRQSLDRYFRRVFSIMTHSLQYVVTYCSNYHMAVSRSKAYSHKKQWCDMNTPHSFQGSIPAHGAMENIHLQPNAPHRHNKTVYLPPPEISNIMTSTTQWKRAYVEQTKNKKFADYLQDPGERVITKKQDKDTQLRQMKTLRHFEPADILNIMRVHLITADSTSSCEVLNRHCEVSVEDLIDNLRETLKLFFPDGIEMTGEEREEACEMFVEWKNTQNLRVALEFLGDTIVETQMLDFLLFEKWFLGSFMATMHQIRTDRLLRHTLHHVPVVKKRALSTAMSLIEGCAQKEVLHTDVHVKTMKALSLVRPDTLVPLNSVRQITPRKRFAIEQEYTV